MEWSLDDETQAWSVFMAWINERPEEIRHVALKYPPGTYKLESSDGYPDDQEYTLIGYDEHADDSEPTAILEPSDGGPLVRNVDVRTLVPIDTMNTRFEKLTQAVMSRARDVEDDQLRDILNYLEKKAEEK
jgi:hypothetical protein